MINVYYKEGNQAEAEKIDRQPFETVKIGEIFVHRSRILMRIVPCWVLVIVNQLDPEMKKANAIRLFTPVKEQVAKYSTISDETLVEIHPDAALYLKG